MSADEEERKVKPLAFRNDQLVIVYDDMSPQADDLCDLDANDRPGAAIVKEFTGLVNDFAKLINSIGRYHFERSFITHDQYDADVLAIPLSQWMAVHRDPDQRLTIHNTPLDVGFLLFFHFPQTSPDDDSWDPIYSSQSVTRIVLEQSARVAAAHTHNIIPLGRTRRLDRVHIGIVCLSKWGGYPDDSRRVLPRFNGLTSRLANEPLRGQDRYYFPLTLEMTTLHLGVVRALEDKEYRRKVVENRLLRRIFELAYFPVYPIWNKEAAALSAVVSHGLTAPDTAFGHAVRGHPQYDPRLFMHVWHFLTGDTLPNLQRDDKRKKEDDDDD